jgi:hypothetical protein
VTVRPAENARAATRRRREERADHVLEVPFNERCEVTCPECGESRELLILADPEEGSPSFAFCSNWDCDAFLKRVWDGTGLDEETGTEKPTQTGLAQFSGGESA